MMEGEIDVASRLTLCFGICAGQCFLTALVQSTREAELRALVKSSWTTLPLPSLSNGVPRLASMNFAPSPQPLSDLLRVQHEEFTGSFPRQSQLEERLSPSRNTGSRF
jgi:hypothetical protein